MVMRITPLLFLVALGVFRSRLASSDEPRQ
jgi:hypothetical protein